MHTADPLVVGLVSFGVGTWRECMGMDIEDAIRTFEIHYINRLNENEAIEAARNPNHKNPFFR